MRSIQDQLTAVLATARPVTPLDVVLADAAGCVLAADLLAPVDLPAAPVAATDGYAVAARDIGDVVAGRAVRLPVAHDVLAGARQPLRLVSGQAIRVASGAPLPHGADVVVPVAYTDRGTSYVEVHRALPGGTGVRPAGSDARADEVVLSAGIRLGAAQIALAAALGLRRLKVHPRPRVIVLSIGDELVEPGAVRTDGAVFDANGPAIAAAVTALGASAHRVPVARDDRGALREVIEDLLVRADLVITTGGLSDGSHDTVKDVLAPLGTVRFDHVSMSPGQVHGFGTVDGAGLGGQDAVPIFALPGHPVAALIAFEVFVRPALRAMAGYTDLFRTSVEAVVTLPWEVPAGVRQFVPAVLVGSPELGYQVTPLGDPLLPDLGNLARANALAVVAERLTQVAAGDRVHALVLAD